MFYLLLGISALVPGNGEIQEAESLGQEAVDAEPQHGCCYCQTWVWSSRLSRGDQRYSQRPFYEIKMIYHWAGGIQVIEAKGKIC